MHMGIDAAGKRQLVPGVENLLGLLGADIGGNLADLAVLDRDVEAIDRRLVRPHEAGILDHEVKRLIHSDASLSMLPAVIAIASGPICVRPTGRAPSPGDVDALAGRPN